MKGERAIYTFNGPLDSPGVWVTCTNYGSRPTDIFVTFFNEVGEESSRVSASAVVQGATVALATRDIPAVVEVAPIGGFSGDLGGGVVGVSDPGAARSVACNGTVFEVSDPPKFMMPISMLRVGAPVKLK